MKHMFRTVTVLSLALLAGCFLLVPPAAQAQINYQGRLTDAVGAPLADGPYGIEFSLWTAATGGAAPVWGPYVLDGGVATGHGPLADLVGSRFNVIIGGLDTTSRSLTTSMAASTTVYLEIKVGNNAPISPRQIILAAPRALAADVIPHVTPNPSGVDVAGNLGVTGNATIAGNAAVTGNATVSGNVGIGTPTPSAKLDVIGNAIVSGNVGIGTNGPAAKLHVRGDIKLGSSGQYFAPAAEENLRIVRGNVLLNGTIQSGTGFNLVGSPAFPTCCPIINFVPPFADTPAVTAIARTDGVNQDNVINLSNLTPSSVQLVIVDENGTGNVIFEASAFSFIAIGAR